MNTKLKLVSIAVSILVWGNIEPLCQTIDARGPIHEVKRRVAAGRSGSMGKRLAITLSVQVDGITPNSRAPFDAEFVLTNSGKEDLVVPISPNPGDLEPNDPLADYSLKHLSLFLTVGPQQELILWGAELYGSARMPETMAVITPGKSLRVLTRFAVPTGMPDGWTTNPKIFVAHAILNDETIRQVNGKTFTEAGEIGSATSTDTPRSQQQKPVP